MIERTLLYKLQFEKANVVIYTINGFQVRGRIESFDDNAILVTDAEGRTKLMYKHAISTIEF